MDLLNLYKKCNEFDFFIFSFILKNVVLVATRAQFFQRMTFPVIESKNRKGQNVSGTNGSGDILKKR